MSELAPDTTGAQSLAGTLVRLRAAADRLAVLADERDAEQSRRDELVCQARDEGHSWREIAGAARCSIGRASAIVAGC